MTSASIFASVLGATVVTRLPPGVSSLVAAHLTLQRGARSAMLFLGGAVATDVVLFAALATGSATLPHPSRWMVVLAGGVLTTLGFALAWDAPRQAERSASPSEDAPVRPAPQRRLLAAGVITPLTQPGYWGWWAVVGSGVLYLSHRNGHAGFIAGATAFLAGVVGTYTAQLTLLHRMRAWLTASVLRLAFRITGLLLATYGTVLIVTAVRTG